MEQEILDIAFEATKTLLRKKINRQHNNELVKEVIDSYSDRKGVKDK
jgi:hypothetical protein